MFNEIGKSNEGVISDGLGLVSTLVENWETVGKVLLTVVSTYGAYKAAVIAIGVAHKMAAIWGEVQAFLSLAKSITSAKDAMLLLNMATSANPVGLILAVVGAAATSYALFSKNTDKAVTMTEKFGASAANAISKIDTLNTIIKGSSQNSELHHKAMDELNAVLQEYGIEALKESASIDDVNRKRQQAIELIKEEAVERQRANALEQGQQDYTNSLKSAKEQLLSDLANATTGKNILGFDFSVSNDEIRDNAAAISSIIGDIVERNISSIAGKTGEEYQKGINVIYSEIQSRMKAIGISDETIGAAWKDGGILWVEDILGKYIGKVQEAEEEHSRFTEAIEKSAAAEKSAAENAMSFEVKVASVSKRLIGAGDDVHGLYKRIKELMAQYSDNTIGFTINFNAEVPAWMNSKQIPELQQLAARFTALGNKATDAGLRIGNKIWSKQELLQRGADYAQAAENKQSEIDKKKKAEESKTEEEKKREAKDAQRRADEARKRIAATEAAEAKLADIIRKQGQERLRIEQDYEFERWQSRVNLMKEGSNKVLAQQELNFTKEKSNLKRRLDDELEAELNRQIAVFDAEENKKSASDKNYGKRQFRDSDIDQSKMDEIKNRYKALEDDLTASQRKAQSDRVKAANEAMNAYLKEFGDYQQKRQAIQSEFASKIDSASTTGEIMTLKGQMRKELSELDYSEWIKSGDVAMAFGDMSNLSKETISRLITDMESYREKVISTFDPTQIREYEETLAALRKEEVSDAFSAFGSMVPEYFTKRLAIQKQINDQAQIGLELAQKQNELNIRTDATKGAIKIQAKSAGYSISDEDLADPKIVQQIADKLAKSASSGDKLTSALHNALLELLKLNKEGAELKEVTKSWDGNFSHLKETLKNLDGEAKFQAIAESVGSAAGLVGNLAGQASEMADALGAEGLGEALGYLGDAMGSVQNIASGFAQGGLIGGIAAAAGEVMNWVTKLAMAGDARHQKNIERIQKKIDNLSKSYDKLGKAADDAYSTDASGIIDQQNQILEQQKVLIQQQMAEEKSKKNSDPEKLKEMQEQLDEINEQIGDNEKKAKEAIVGKDLKSAIDEFASAYASAWEEGTDSAQASMKAVKSIISSALTELLKKNIQPAADKFYNALADAMEDGILTDAELANLDAIKSQMDALAASGEEQYKKIQERYKDLDELREELTDISFDSVSDNFKSLLTDMTSTTEDFTENWTDMVRNSLIEGLMDNKYDKMLKEWYDEFAEDMNDQTLTDSERDALRQQYDAIVQQGIADRDAINSIVGGGAYSQQASSGSAWNMNQETGDELNGRFTAMVELEATNNTLVSAGNSLAASILSTLQAMAATSKTVAVNGDNETLLSIRDMMFLSTGHLEDIAKYTKYLISMNEEMVRMRSAIDKL